MPSALLLAALLSAAAPAAPVIPVQPAARTPAEPAAPAPPAADPAGAAQGPAVPSHQAPAAAEAAEATASAALPARAKEAAPATERPDPSAPQRTSRSTPPSLTSRALLDELRRTAKDRQVEQSSMGEEHRRLEELQKSIEKARADLRQETARLQALVAAEGAKPAARTPGKPATDPLDGLARTARGMKPDQAAAMMARLDRGLAAAILGRMRPADAALVLEKLDPATGASLIALLAARERS